jgi:drug/metabolite transporter (DMT)-like permease
LSAYDWARLLGLAVIWSVQYIFLRISVPVFGAWPVSEARAVLGAVLLVVAALALGQRIAPLERWKDHLIVSLPNAVLPFVCFSWAAVFLPAGYLSIINGTVPLWAGVFAAWALKDPLTPRMITGFLLGLAGVALIVKLGPVEFDLHTVFGALLALVGAALWGWGGVVIKQRTGRIAPIAMAAGSSSFAAIIMAPLWLAAPPPSAWTLAASSAMLALGLLCSGAAYIVFYTLVRDIGPTRSLTTGLMAPLLGVLGGSLFLDEAVTAAMLGGCALVLAALALVLRR